MRKKNDELTDLIQEYVNKVDDCYNMQIKERLFKHIAAAQDVIKQNTRTVADLDLLKRIWKTCEGLLNAAPTLRDDKTIMKHMANIEMELDIKEIATPQQAERPFVIDKVLESKQAQGLFEVYKKKGYFTIHEGGQYEWLTTDEECAIFAAVMSDLFPSKKNPHDKRTYHWKPFEDLFGKKQLCRTFNKVREDIKNTQINKIFIQNYKA